MYVEICVILKRESRSISIRRSRRLRKNRGTRRSISIRNRIRRSRRSIRRSVRRSIRKRIRISVRRSIRRLKSKIRRSSESKITT